MCVLGQPMEEKLWFRREQRKEFFHEESRQNEGKAVPAKRGVGEESRGTLAFNRSQGEL